MSKIWLDRFEFNIDWHFLIVLLLIAFTLMTAASAFAVDLSGEDLSGDMEAVQSLFVTADTVLFGWIRPFAAAIFGFIGCVGLIRSNFLMFCLGFAVSAIVLLIPQIVHEFEKSGKKGIFSKVTIERSLDRYV